MFFSGRQKQLPNLSEYLEKKIQLLRERRGDELADSAGIGVILGLGLPLAAFFQFTGYLIPAIATLGLVAALLVPSWRRYRARKEQAKLGLRKHEADALGFVEVLYPSLQKRRLHRDLDRATGQLLEECARNYLRVHETLDSPYWQSDKLPGHFRTLRGQAIAASEHAMDEVMVLLSDAHNPAPQKSGIADMLDTVMEGLNVGVAEAPTADRLPVGFEPARQLADKLQMLAAEVERSTRDVAQDDILAEEFTAGSSLDVCLHDLKTIRQAEEELRQNLGR